MPFIIIICLVKQKEKKLLQQTRMFPYNIVMLVHLSILFLPKLVFAKCTCESQIKGHGIEHEALEFKLIGIGSILLASAIGVCIPLLLKNVRALQPETGLHFLIKAFAAGVILATGFIHILPDAFASLTSPCLPENPWGGFPFAGFIAMMAAIVTLMMEALATGYHRRAEMQKPQPLDADEEANPTDAGHVHGPAILLERSNSSSLIRNRIVSQVLELGIVFHSTVIGVSMGATQNPKIIKSLIAALSFHQFFEGIGLGGCISQAKFKARTITTMVLFFSLTTPAGIAIGILISKRYNEYSPTALVVQGVLDSASSGILIYMALVDLLAADFMNPKLQTDFRVQFGANFSLLLGACCMSLMAKWGDS
ncbi:zinc transporter 5-like [Coffea arabica]|nr:zinc transporter 5-like [Coffea arabica]